MNKCVRIRNLMGLVTSCILAIIFFSCTESNGVISLDDNELFSLEYGNFEDQLNLFSLASPSPVRTSLAMRDGFFYIANGEAQKVLELNSYGDLLSIYYNGEGNPTPSFADAADSQIVSTTRKAVEYPFNSLGAIAADSRKYIYVVDQLPPERHEQDVENRLLLSQIILRFASDGTFIDYIGQRGPGGMPFPYIKNIYTTYNSELVVVCQMNDGMVVYWFDKTGYLRSTIPFKVDQLPNVLDEEDVNEVYISLENIVPSYTEEKLFVKVDYYTSSIDVASNVESGIDYAASMLFPLDINTGVYEEPFSIPAYEQEVADGFSRLVYNLSYDFLGVTDSGWLFFIIADDTGYNIQMVQESGDTVLRRHLDLDHHTTLYHSISLSPEGIISMLLAEEDEAKVLWWRTDSLIDAILKG
ncbi:MAG: hypothetical protein PUH08_09220 [Treponema sp.]|nr:hypothetical protein [Spirochaetia bacterium]MDD7275836.1 hypothetical protein [Treponema sp.]MDY3755027.1 hypothetical protein [Treponema sp.]